IPYAKSCKVTYTTDVLMDIGARRGEAVYYQINYRTYPEGTEVESFSMERLEAAREKLDSVQKQLRSDSLDVEGELKSTTFTTKLKPGQSSEATSIEGPGAIREFRVKLAADDLPQALRSTILKLEFDGKPTVWIPV